VPKVYLRIVPLFHGTLNKSQFLFVIIENTYYEKGILKTNFFGHSISEISTKKIFKE